MKYLRAIVFWLVVLLTILIGTSIYVERDNYNACYNLDDEEYNNWVQSNFNYNKSRDMVCYELLIKKNHKNNYTQNCKGG